MTSEGMKAMQQISAALEANRELSDAELIIQYRAWQAEYEALEALERSWKRSETERHSDLWSLIFEGAHDALPAAFREIDRLQEELSAVIDRLNAANHKVVEKMQEIDQLRGEG